MDFQYSFFEDFYSCKTQGTGLTITLTNRTVRSVSGNHIPGRNLLDVKQLYIRGQNCEVTPRGISRFLPNIQNLAMPHSKVKYLFNDDLREFKNLRAIDFAYSKFTTINSAFFAAAKHLEVISFRRCRDLKIIGQTTFNSLSKLKTLQLKETKCIDAEVINNRTEVEQLIRKARIACRDPREEIFTETIETTTLISEQTTKRLEAITDEVREVDNCQNRVTRLEHELATAQNYIRNLTEILRNKNSL